jgi:hypothetical protein
MGLIMKPHPTMSTWKSTTFGKKNGSQTTGRSKGIRPSALQKSMCRRGRSYKHPLYGAVMASLGSRKQKGN